MINVYQIIEHILKLFVYKNVRSSMAQRVKDLTAAAQVAAEA